MSPEQDRTAVRTYVPEGQYERWATEADSMDMSLSEFVRSMVQAGRRGFDLGGSNPPQRSNPEEGHLRASDPGGHGLEDRVLSTLESEGVASWDSLVEELSGDFEEQLDSALDALMDAGEIKLDHRRGGYRRREA